MLTKDKVAHFMWALSHEARCNDGDRRKICIETDYTCEAMDISLEDFKVLIHAAQGADWKDGPTYYHGALAWCADAEWLKVTVIIGDWALGDMTPTRSIGLATDAVMAAYAKMT